MVSPLELELNSLVKCREINYKICKIIKNVIDKIIPDPEYEEMIKKKSYNVLALFKELLNPLKDIYDFDRIELHGSVEKGTWILSKVDLDIFIVFKKFVKKEKIEEMISKISGLIPFEHEYRYSEHPYLYFKNIEGFEVDLVPAFDFKGEKFITTTDRTLYHTKFIKKHLNDVLRNEIRLLKAFLTAIDCYGAEIKIGGFSGYATELLVIKLGSFLDVIEFFANSKKIFIDFYKKWDEEKAFKFFKTSFVIVDPVDSKRNVLAPLREDTFNKVKLASRLFLSHPNKYFLIKSENDERYEISLDRNILIVELSSKQMIPPDKLWGILYRISSSLEKILTKENFKAYLVEPIVLNEKKYLITIELSHIEKPKYTKVIGPPIDAKLEQIRNFIKKYSNAETGPWLEGNRLVAVIKTPQEKKHAKTIIIKHVEEIIKRYKGEIYLKSVKQIKKIPKETLEKISRYLSKKDLWLKK